MVETGDVVVPCYLGIDPGLNRTGYGLLRRTAKGPVIVEGGVIRSTKGNSLLTRVHEIASAVREILAEFKPTAVAVEQIFSHVEHPKTAILMAHARGAILFAIADAKIPMVHYTPTSVKRTLTGSGRANKEQVQRAIQRELKLQAILEPNDVSDAFAIALCHYHSVKHSSLVPAARNLPAA